MISKEQAGQVAEALLEGERLAHRRRRQAEKLASRYAELTAWPESQRLAVWRQASAAVDWDWRTVSAVIVFVVPNLVLLGLAAWSLSHLRGYRLPYLLPMSAPLGLLAIQAVRQRCLRRTLREMAPRTNSAGVALGNN